MEFSQSIDVSTKPKLNRRIKLILVKIEACIEFPGKTHVVDAYNVVNGLGEASQQRFTRGRPHLALAIQTL